MHLRRDDIARQELLNRFGFFDRDHTDFIFDGFSSEMLGDVLHDGS